MLFVVEGRLEVFNHTTLVWVGGGGGVGVSGLRYKGRGGRFVHYAKRGHFIEVSNTFAPHYSGSNIFILIFIFFSY